MENETPDVVGSPPSGELVKRGATEIALVAAAVVSQPLGMLTDHALDALKNRPAKPEPPKVELRPASTPTSRPARVVADEPVYVCPACRRPVADDEPWIAAQEGLPAAGFGPPEHPDDDYAWGSQVRFHNGHYRRDVGRYVYRLVQAD